MSDLPITTSQLPLRQAVTELQPSAIRAFSAAVANIPGIIDLTVGEPDFNTPDTIKAAAVTSLEQNHTHYPPRPELLNYGKQSLLTSTKNMTLIIRLTKH